VADEKSSLAIVVKRELPGTGASKFLEMEALDGLSD